MPSGRAQELSELVELAQRAESNGPAKVAEAAWRAIAAEALRHLAEIAKTAGDSTAAKTWLARAATLED